MCVCFIGPDYSTYICEEGQCKGHMGIAEGGNCMLAEYDPSYFILGSLQCAEGLACIPNERDGREGKCGKVTSKLENAQTCASDDDCSSDTFCTCNDATGQSICAPFPVSDPVLLTKFDKYYKDCHDCYLKYGDGHDYLMCAASKDEDISKYIAEHVYSISTEYRCADYSLLPSYPTSPSSSSSFVAPTPTPASPSSSSSFVAPTPTPGTASSSSYVSGFTPIVIITKYVEIVFGKEDMKKKDVEEIVDKFVPKDTKYDVVVVLSKDGKTTVEVGFKSAEVAKSFVDALSSTSNSEIAAEVKSIKYINDMHSGVSALVPSLFTLLTLKLFF